MDNKTIVAIEIASSKIKGAVGTVSPDGRVTVLAAAETPGHGNVRYGRVQNIREVSTAVDGILRALEDAGNVAPRRIRSLALSLGGRSLASCAAKASLSFPKECEITANQVDRLAIEAASGISSDRYILATVPRTYFVNNLSMPRPVGSYGESFRGEFTIVTCAKETHQNLERLHFEGIDAGNTATVLLPTAIADFVLTPEEKSVGTVFADFGAETTTVAVYKDGSLAFLCTIPMGARLITRDLMTAFSTTEENAEEIIRKYADGKENSDARNYIRARAGEIIANVQHQLEAAGFGKDIVGKAVITGGATNIPDIRDQFEQRTKLRTRLADMPANVTFRIPGRNNADNIDIVALLAAAAPCFRDSCLTSNEIISETAADEPVVVVRETVQPQHSHIAGDDDNDDILRDDEDDDTADKGTKRKFWSFGKNKDKKKKKVDIDEFEENVPEESEEYVEPEKPQTPEKQKSDIMEGFGKRMMKIFADPDNLYEEDNSDK